MIVPLTITKANFSAMLTHAEQSAAYGWLRSYYFPLYDCQSSLLWIDIGGTSINPFCVCNRCTSHFHSHKPLHLSKWVKLREIRGGGMKWDRGAIHKLYCQSTTSDHISTSEPLNHNRFWGTELMEIYIIRHGFPILAINLQTFPFFPFLFHSLIVRGCTKSWMTQDLRCGRSKTDSGPYRKRVAARPPQNHNC